MLENYLRDPAGIARRRAGLFGAHLESFIATVCELGYRRSTVREQLRILDQLERWLKRRGLPGNRWVYLGATVPELVRIFLPPRRSSAAGEGSRGGKKC